MARATLVVATLLAAATEAMVGHGPAAKVGHGPSATGRTAREQDRMLTFRCSAWRSHRIQHLAGF